MNVIKFTLCILFILLSQNINSQDDEDTSSSCYLNVEATDDGAYEEADSICILSSHGPITYIEVKFGNKHREVRLENVFSEDYVKIKKMIIEAVGVKRWIKKK